MTNLTPRELEVIGLPASVYDQLASAADGKMDDTPGAMSDLLAELFDWVNLTRLVSPQLLNQAEAVEVRKEIGDEWGLGSDLEDELYRTSVLGIGADRSAEQTLRDLIQAEREDEQWIKVANA